MQVRYFKKIFDQATAAATSDTVVNLYSDTLSVQLEGTFTSISFKVLGKTTMESDEFIELSGINLNTFDVANPLTAKGVYEFPVEGICILKFQIASISGGNVTANVRLVSTGD